MRNFKKQWKIVLVFGLVYTICCRIVFVGRPFSVISPVIVSLCGFIFGRAVWIHVEVKNKYYSSHANDLPKSMKSSMFNPIKIPFAEAKTHL